MQVRIPFDVNVADLSKDEVADLASSLQNVFGAQFFVDIELFLDVIEDKKQKAKDPYLFLYGPFLRVARIDENTLRLTSEDVITPGTTVYGKDQIEQILALQNNVQNLEKLKEQSILSRQR